MARSTYIYVVMLEGDVVGAFTVKREMVSRLERVATSWPNLVEAYRVYRHAGGVMIGEESPVFMGTGRWVLDG